MFQASLPPACFVSIFFLACCSPTFPERRPVSASCVCAEPLRQDEDESIQAANGWRWPGRKAGLMQAEQCRLRKCMGYPRPTSVQPKAEASCLTRCICKDAEGIPGGLTLWLWPLPYLPYLKIAIEPFQLSAALNPKGSSWAWHLDSRITRNGALYDKKMMFVYAI